ncbi:hypothetical protein J4205_00385 [Candidatus Pacearchaeota archaeon]|nr:hypothetical protein [Candidatus Pacearchaeota archaeon]
MKTETRTNEKKKESKFSVNANAKKINSISIEHVKKSGKIVHSFLLILVEATSKDKINMMSIENNKKRIISSDYKLLKDYQQSELKINTLYSKD